MLIEGKYGSPPLELPESKDISNHEPAFSVGSPSTRVAILAALVIIVDKISEISILGII